MFSSTVFQVVKSLGAGTLCGVQSVTTTKDIVPFGIVIKESRRWFLLWKKFRNYSTEFHLNDVVQGDPLELDKLVSTRRLVDYFRSSKFSLKGKFGVDLKKDLVGLDVTGDDTITIEANLGEIDQTDVDVSEFLKILEGRQINVQHPLIASLIKDHDSKTMCLITSVVTLKKDAVLSCVNDKDMTEKTDVEGGVLGKAEEDVEVDDDKTKKMTIPAGTPLAYGVHELRVDMKTGHLELVPHHTGSGGFVSSLDLDTVDAGEETAGTASVSDSQTEWSLESCLEMQADEEREALRQAVIALLAEIRVVAPLVELLQQAVGFIETNVEKISSGQYVEEKLGCPAAVWQGFLQLAGFVWQEGQIVYPEEQTDVFQACEFLLSLLDFMDGQTMENMRAVLEDTERLPFISSLLKRLWSSCQAGEEQLQLEGDEAEKLREFKAGLTLLGGLEVEVKGGGGALVASKVLGADVQAVYLAVTSLTPSPASRQPCPQHGSTDTVSESGGVEESSERDEDGQGKEKVKAT